MHKIGHATRKGDKLYFDTVGWAMVKEVARRKHKSPQYIVVRALMLLLEKK